MVGQGEVEQNQELDLRLLGMLGGSYQIVRNQSIEFSAGAGVAANHELFVGEDKKEGTPPAKPLHSNAAASSAADRWLGLS